MSQSPFFLGLVVTIALATFSGVSGIGSGRCFSTGRPTGFLRFFGIEDSLDETRLERLARVGVGHKWEPRNPAEKPLNKGRIGSQTLKYGAYIGECPTNPKVRIETSRTCGCRWICA